MNNTSNDLWFIDRKERSESIEIFDAHHIVISLIVDIGLQLSCFLISVIGRVEKIKHVGGISFLIIALMTLILAQTFEMRQIIVTIFVCVWAVRLSGYLLLRTCYSAPKIIFQEDVEEVEVDARHQKVVQSMIFWTVQAVWVFLVSLPVVLINSPVYSALPEKEKEHLNDRDKVGMAMWILGFLCEIFADWQKLNFKRNFGNEEKFCTNDLWTWSRHPNYFGEMLQWWGIFTIFTQIVHEDWMWLGICSPLFISAVLLFVQMPALEQHSDVRFGRRAEYQEYKNSTSPIIPMPPELYIKFPHFLKMLLLFEFPLYDHLPEEARSKETEKVCPKAVRRLEMPY